MYEEGDRQKPRPQGLGQHPRDHEVRVQILDLLANGRGLTPGEVCEQLPDRSFPTVHYHLLVLRRAKAVRASSDDEPRYALA